MLSVVFAASKIWPTEASRLLLGIKRPDVFYVPRINLDLTTMAEKQLQSKLIAWLKSKGCYVIKTQPGLGVPVGCPDVIALYEGAWMAFECKQAANSKLQPLQKETLDKLADWGYAMVVHNGNYQAVISDLKRFLG
jgi:hypothetical protein